MSGASAGSPTPLAVTDVTAVTSVTVALQRGHTRHMIEIDLGAPPRVGQLVARPQSLWLLLRMWWATQHPDAGASTDDGWVREAQLRARFAQSRNLRMLISRAFVDFAQWGVAVGWGLDRSRAPELLSLNARCRGPFWLVDGQAQRLSIRMGEQPANTAQIAQWLQLEAPVASSNTASSQPIHQASPAYWHAWAGGRRELLDGLLIAPGERGALAAYRRAQQHTDDPWLGALALLQQAIVWRRAGNADAARRVLDELDRQWQDRQSPQHAWLGAMAAIVRAWCAYASRDVQSAALILQQASSDPRWTALFQYHPRLRCEQSNLQALIQRAQALDEQESHAMRQQAALSAVTHYQQALALANEAELFDAAAAAASNLGWSLWLFARCGLDCSIVQTHPPLSWIALASWLSVQHGVGGGCWNDIYLLRMVRGGGPQQPHPELAEFRRWPVPDCSAVAQQIAPLKLPVGASSWLSHALQLQNRVDSGELQIDALQRANLLLEVAWYQAHAGELRAAQAAASALRRRLRELNPGDRGFFRDALRCLPELG